MTLNLFLIPKFGINGAAVSTLDSQFVTLIGVPNDYENDVDTNIPLLKTSLLQDLESHLNRVVNRSVNTSIAKKSQSFAKVAACLALKVSNRLSKRKLPPSNVNRSTDS